MMQIPLDSVYYKIILKITYTRNPKKRLCLKNFNAKSSEITMQSLSDSLDSNCFNRDPRINNRAPRHLPNFNMIYHIPFVILRCKLSQMS